MRATLLTLSLAGLAIAGDPARVTSPVLGYVFDSASKSMRPIAGVPGAAAIEAAVPSASRSRSASFRKTGATSSRAHSRESF